MYSWGPTSTYLISYHWYWCQCVIFHQIVFIQEKHIICFSYMTVWFSFHYFTYTTVLFSRIFLAHISYIHICFMFALQSYLMSSHVLSKPLLTQSAWWCFYNTWLVSESKPGHKLARLQAFKENTLINFHWLWNAGSVFEICGCS